MSKKEIITSRKANIEPENKSVTSPRANVMPWDLPETGSLRPPYFFPSDLAKDVRLLVFTAVLTALAIILNSYGKIRITETLEVRFSFLPIAVSGYLFGPFIGAIVGILADVVGYLLNPTGAYFPGFTLNYALIGVLFGLFIYRVRPAQLSFAVRLVIAELLHTFVINLVLNSMWLSILYGKGFWFRVTASFLKQIITAPINCALLYLVLTAVAVPAFQSIIPFKKGKAS